jgi:hypothetical protein
VTSLHRDGVVAGDEALTHIPALEALWLAPRSACSTHGDVSAHIVHEKRWAPGAVWMKRKHSAPISFDPRLVQPLASRDTDWMI